MLAERHVLVVENEETICTVVADCLADWPGIKVECAHDGITGVKKLQSQKFSLAVIEMMLPGLSGLDVAQAAVNEDIPVLMLSGHPEVIAKLMSVNLPHLEKPFRMAKLLRESKNAVACSRENISQLRASLALLKEPSGALQAAMEEHHQMLAESIDQWARASGLALK